MRIGAVRLAGVACALLLSAVRVASAQPAPPPQLNQNCTVSVLNRTVTANADGTWILPNVPANFGPVRARVTCVVNGQTISGESDPFTVPANGAVNIPQIRFGQTTAIPTALTIAAPSGPLTQPGATLQLAVTARYPDNSTNDVTPGGSGTTYTVTNPAIATVSGDGVVQAISSGTVIVQASHEGASGMASIRVALGGGSDSDNDGIPDADELALGLNPNNPIDAMEDFDRDNLTNLQEYQLGTDLRTADTDGDGLRDGDEVNIYGTNSLLPDTDVDLIPDGVEIQTSTDPLNRNSYDLRAATASSVLQPPTFTLATSVLFPEASQQLRWRVNLIDGRTTLDLTPDVRTSYSSSDLATCSFGAQKGLVFAGAAGTCLITISQNTLSVTVPGTVESFAPREIGAVSVGGAVAVDVAGSFAYIAAGSSGLVVVDVTDRAAPRIRGTLAGIGNVQGVRAVGQHAFVVDSNGFLRVVQTTDPDAPALIFSVAIPGSPIALSVRGGLMAVAAQSGGVSLLDISDPEAPTLVGTITVPGSALGVDLDLVRRWAAVAMGTAGLQLVDVSNVNAPVLRGRLAGGDVRRVLLNFPAALLADTQRSVTAVDISNPDSLSISSSTPPNLGGAPVDIASFGAVAITADVSFGAVVPILNVSNPLQPNTVLFWALGARNFSSSIAMDARFGYLVMPNMLRIFHYRDVVDNFGVPPVIQITTPADDADIIQGSSLTVAADATDDVAVSSLTFSVNGQPTFTSGGAPYQFTFTTPATGSTLTLGVTAVDFGSNVGTATDVVIRLIPDPLTRAEGRVLRSGGLPASGATVTCGAASTLTLGDGTFALDGLPTVQTVIACVARFVETDGTILGGVSAPVTAIRGGVTNIGDIVLAPVPVIDSITPNVVDALRPPATLDITGSNLSGATFLFVPELSPPAITVGAAQIDAMGTAATLPITVAPTARGRFTLIGTNAFGVGNATPMAGNALTLINVQDDVDSDGDGYADGLELLFGSDPSDASSRPNLARQGDVSSLPVSVVNRLFPSTFSSTGQAQSLSFSVVNRLFPSTFVTTREAQSLSFSVVNRLFPSTFVTTREAQSLSFSVVNRLFPSAFSRSGEAVSLRFSLLNDPAGPPTPPSTATSTASAAVAAVTLEWPMTGDALIEGQTVVLGISNPGDQVASVEFSVNGVAMDRDATAPYELLFTVPAGVSNLTFAATVADTSGDQVAATPLVVGVVPDLTIAVSGRVVDSSGNPVAGVAVDILSEGADAELFDFTAPLNELPDLTGRTPDRTTRITAVNTRNQERVFGDDPLGSRSLPDYAGRLTGWMPITVAGTYTFVVGANEGARLRVGDITVVDMMGGVTEYREQQGQIVLPAGLVPFQLEFYQSVGNGELKLSFAPPGGGLRTVSPSLLIPSGRVLRAVTDSAGRFRVANVPTALGSIQVRATTATGGNALSELQIPTPTTDVDIGNLSVVP